MLPVADFAHSARGERESERGGRERLVLWTEEGLLVTCDLREDVCETVERSARARTYVRTYTHCPRCPCLMRLGWEDRRQERRGLFF